jgi:hypothetical protein
VNSRDSFVREFRMKFSSWVFTCGVLTSWRSDRLINQNQDSHAKGKTLGVQQGMKLVVESHWLWAVKTDCNYEEVPVNPIMRSRTHCYLSRYSTHMAVFYLFEVTVHIPFRRISNDILQKFGVFSVCPSIFPHVFSQSEKG